MEAGNQKPNIQNNMTEGIGRDPTDGVLNTCLLVIVLDGMMTSPVYIMFR